MNFLAITAYIWMGLLVTKALGFPLVKELTWSQLFLVPVVVFLVRFGLILFWILFTIVGMYLLALFAQWSANNLDLSTGY